MVDIAIPRPRPRAHQEAVVQKRVSKHQKAMATPLSRIHTLYCHAMLGNVNAASELLIHRATLQEDAAMLGNVNSASKLLVHRSTSNKDALCTFAEPWRIQRRSAASHTHKLDLRCSQVWDVPAVVVQHSDGSWRCHDAQEASVLYIHFHTSNPFPIVVSKSEEDYAKLDRVGLSPNSYGENTIAHASV